MYIEKRNEQGKIKYFLAHSFREGNKIHKIRKYLGLNLSSQLLEERRKKAAKLIFEEVGEFKIINDPLKLRISGEEIRFVKNLEIKEKLKVFHLSKGQWKVFSQTFAYNTNAIEGSEITNKESINIIERNEWPKKPKEDIAETYGVYDAINFIKQKKEHFSLELIKKMHRLVFRNSKEFAGEFRKPGEEVAIKSGSGEIIHMGVPQSRVVSLLLELIDWYEKNKKRYPSLVLAAVVHNQFENIHPFRDGNGRVGRLLLNNILIKHRLPPVNISFKNRRQYYNSILDYEKNQNIRPTIDLILKEYRFMKKKFSNKRKPKKESYY